MYNLVFTEQQVEIIYRSLLELPGKFTLDVIREFEKQIAEQRNKNKQTKEEEKKDE